MKMMSKKVVRAATRIRKKKTKSRVLEARAAHGRFSCGNVLAHEPLAIRGRRSLHWVPMSMNWSTAALDLKSNISPAVSPTGVRHFALHWRAHRCGLHASIGRASFAYNVLYV